MFRWLVQASLVIVLVVPWRVLASGEERITVCNEAQLEQSLARAADDTTIEFSCSGTIFLHTVKTIRKNLILDASRNVVTLDGQNRTAILRIENGASVTIKGLAFVNGRAESGGDAINNRGLLTLIDCLFTGHQHAIVNFNGLSIINSRFINNTGNAIYNAAKLDVKNSVFDGNGRGIDNGSGQATVADSTFRNNKTRPHEIGAGIANSGLLSVSASSFYGNAAEQGGAIGNHRAGQVSLSNSRLINNQQSNCFGPIREARNNIEWPDQTCGDSKN